MKGLEDPAWHAVAVEDMLRAQGHLRALGPHASATVRRAAFAGNVPVFGLYANE